MHHVESDLHFTVPLVSCAVAPCDAVIHLLEKSVSIKSFCFVGCGAVIHRQRCSREKENCKGEKSMKTHFACQRKMSHPKLQPTRRSRHIKALIICCGLFSALRCEPTPHGCVRRLSLGVLEQHVLEAPELCGRLIQARRSALQLIHGASALPPKRIQSSRSQSTPHTCFSGRRSDIERDALVQFPERYPRHGFLPQS